LANQGNREWLTLSLGRGVFAWGKDCRDLAQCFAAIDEAMEEQILIQMIARGDAFYRICGAIFNRWSPTPSLRRGALNP
jgi:hypothetical protein